MTILPHASLCAFVPMCLDAFALNPERVGGEAEEGGFVEAV